MVNNVPVGGPGVNRDPPLSVAGTEKARRTHCNACRLRSVLGQGGRARTPDFLLPKQARYQLRYTLRGSYPDAETAN